MDEPTANLDYGNQHRVLRCVQRLAHEDGYTVILSTHNPQHALSYADAVLALHGGAVETQNDHRLAMSAAVAACAATGEVTVDNDACVAKSYPRFWEDYGSLKGEGL